MAGGGGGDAVPETVLNAGDYDDDDACLITDPIHGPMKFHSLLKAIIDTPQFQRLRDIKQLGGSFYVYPSADHSRFVHSLGVAHLARKMVLELTSYRPYRQLVDEKDILCVSIAGLIHDLGHGPYSHLWENFVSRQRPSEGWAHEDQSYKMFEDLIEKNDLWPLFEAEGFDERDLIFIRELIHPPKASGDDYPFLGRDPGKEFLYQIVSNPFSGIDVDKMDYIARDAKALGVDVNYDFRRYLEFARILQMDDEFWTVQTDEGPKRVKKLFVGIRDKEAMNMVSLFRTRQDLHRKAYQHKTTKIIESVLLKIFAEVDDEEIFPVYSPTLDCDLRLSTAHRQTDAYITLTNDILNRIRYTRPAKELSEGKRKKLERAQQMIANLDCRKLPKFVHAISFNPAVYKEWLKPAEEKWKNDLIRHHDTSSGVELYDSDVEFVVINFDYGQKNNDPIEKVPFYRKNGTLMRTNMREISHTLPGDSNIAEQKIFVYATNESKREIVARAARRWEETKKTEWSTPKRLRTVDESPPGIFETCPSSTKTGVEAFLSPASSMGEVEEEVKEGEEPQLLPEEDPFDRPDTPPLSQQTARAHPMVESRDDVKAEDGDGFGGVRRNLFCAFEDAPSPDANQRPF